MEDIIEYIERIKQITTDIYSDIFKMTGEDILKYGGCLEFIEIMQNMFINSKIYVRYDQSHCAILIDDLLYDVSGVIKDRENYHEASSKEINYIENEFGKYFKCLKISENVIYYLNNNYKEYN